MRELIHTIRCDFCDFKRHRVSGPGRGKPVPISILTWYSRHNFRTLNENRNLKKKPSVALNPLVSLFYLLVARGSRKSGNRWTDRRTERRTDRQSTVTLAADAR